MTVTSSSARFPIAITSSSTTPLHAVLVVSGPELTSSSYLDVVLKRGHDQLHRPRAHTHLGRFEPAAAASVARRAPRSWRAQS